jgi:hypothetical protein
MIVYGDGQRREDTAALLAGLGADCEAVLAAPAGLPRQSAATRLLIAAGELTQGLLDATFADRGDDWGELEETCSRLTVEAARLERGGLGIGPVVDALASLRRLPVPEAVTVRIPEGFAFYALYPEQYALATRRLRNAVGGQPIVVLGLRSIGTSLAAVVAVAAGAAELPVTLRPVGHPFRRTLHVAPRLEHWLLDRVPAASFAIVDEGPGLSGSSFGAAADWLEERGVRAEQLCFFPGHGGDLGPQADPRHRQRWRRARREVADFETLLAHPFFEDDSSARALAPEDIGGGKWRAHLFARAEDWPPANPQQERRKYLYRARGTIWLAKFAGLGRYGEAKLARGRRLQRAGLIPPIRELRRGFLIGEWLTAARPLAAAGDVDRAALLERVADYLGLLAREFPAPAGAAGATPEQLLHMARHNTQEWHGPELAGALDPWREALSVLGSRLRPVLTDNRMHAWEWLVQPGGQILKADALDHHQGHDCIGPQDITWDVVGAAVELGLSADEQEQLDARLARISPYRPDALVKGFYRSCYLAFQMGYYALATSSLPPDQGDEVQRFRAAAGRYADLLRHCLIP